MEGILFVSSTSCENPEFRIFLAAFETRGKSNLAGILAATERAASRGGGLDFLADGCALFAFGTHELVVELEIHPHARCDSKELAEAEIVFRGAATLALFHLREVRGGDSAAAGNLGLGHAGFSERLAESLGEEVEEGDVG